MWAVCDPDVQTSKPAGLSSAKQDLEGVIFGVHGYSKNVLQETPHRSLLSGPD
jgi:hypothetical protein